MRPSVSDVLTRSLAAAVATSFVVACSDSSDTGGTDTTSAAGSGGAGAGAGGAGAGAGGASAGAGGASAGCGLTCTGMFACTGSLPLTGTLVAATGACVGTVTSNIGKDATFTLACDGSATFTKPGGGDDVGTWTGSGTAFVLMPSGTTYTCTITP